ncbi:cysteine--tRNA ligase [Candidatus Peribacteria bacterium RIFCSPLOWO2_12_FULL_55_15]|nr:MAG: cysteine--tRNA ligase [Candidatus Peribacteria bacterium RIFCSPLOWO2_01_FULL_54_110]OGJ69226.1 MAG: cysteine--tRNA ligase [Candidatus Peribacteria bacterium RIFCSPLOWO2_02_FULL_55_36]OGJ71419.1 MAG: cysteine--tRNA ligase [Candidatus Peribacteria bacterium RIFCSPLOWO2_12_FULL_55_15]
MPLRLYNTLTKKEEDFVLLAPPCVTMYTCGPTVYSRPHIGNYSSFLMADILRRWLEVGHGYDVKHVKNITDVGHLLHDADHGDDKIQKEAEKENVHPLEIAKRHIEEYLEDEKLLNILEPAYRPRATEFIEQMKTMTEALLTSGHAYVIGDGVYFDVTSKTLTPYGALSGNTIDAVKAGARVAIKEEKKHPSDFALWKFCVSENVSHILRWPSPQLLPTSHYSLPTIPEGFPGWHIECSTMSRSLLGDQIDIHTGGEDNIFPHHECEIAQSESVTGKKPFVRYWLHKRRIDMGGAKMSKSLGNVLSLDDIRERGFDPMDLRYYLLSVHYRTHLKFSWKGMDDARKARRSIVEWMKESEDAECSLSPRLSAEVRLRRTKEGERVRGRDEGTEQWQKKFAEAMDADINTPAALAAVFDCMTWSRTSPLSSDERKSLRSFCGSLSHTFGCFDAAEEVIPRDVQSLMDARAAARAAKNFAESDRLRGFIEKTGYEVRDTPKGQVVRRR